MAKKVAEVWVRRASETAKEKLKSKADYSPVKGEELLVRMPVDLSELSQFASSLAESGALRGETLRLMIFGTTTTDHKELHGDINVNNGKFTVTGYLPFMKEGQTVEDYVESVADQLCDSASKVQGTITGLMVGLEQIQLKKPVKTY